MHGARESHLPVDLVSGQAALLLVLSCLFLCGRHQRVSGYPHGLAKPTLLPDGAPALGPALGARCDFTPLVIASMCRMKRAGRMHVTQRLQTPRRRSSPPSKHSGTLLPPNLTDVHAIQQRKSNWRGKAEKEGERERDINLLKGWECLQQG